jgi:anti-sigma B factor antagonist
MSDASASPRSAPDGFRCHIVIEPDRARIVLVGELDLATAPRLAEALRTLTTHVVVDLRQLTFIDSTGLQLLLRGNEAARRRELRFGLIAGPPAVQRIFELTGTHTVFEFETPLARRSTPKRRHAA